MIVVTVVYGPSERIGHGREESSRVGEIQIIPARIGYLRDFVICRIKSVFVPIVIVDGVHTTALDKVCLESFVVVEHASAFGESEYSEMSVVVEDIPVGFTTQIHIVVMVPVDTRWPVVVELILVTELELVGKLVPWDAHEGILIREFPLGEIDRVSVVNSVLLADGYIGLVPEILHEYRGSSLGEVVLESRIGEDLIGRRERSCSGGVVA